MGWVSGSIDAKDVTWMGDARVALPVLAYGPCFSSANTLSVLPRWMQGTTDIVLALTQYSNKTGP